MPILIHEELERGWQLLNEGKIKEALVLIAEIEQNEDLTPVEKLKCQICKGRGFIEIGKFEEALSIGKNVEIEAIKIGKPLLAIDAIVFSKFGAFFLLDKKHEVWKDIVTCETLLKSAINQPQSEIEEGQALLKFLKGYFYFWEGKLNCVLEYYKPCLTYFEQSPRLFGTVIHILNVLGATYVLKGELNLGLEYLLRSIALSKDTPIDKRTNAGNLIWIGGIYHQQGKLDLAVDYYKKSIKAWKEYKDPMSLQFICLAYNNLIKISLDKNNLEKAKDYLQKLELFIEKNPSYKAISYHYELSKARILRASPRTRDKAEAEKILKEIIDYLETLKESRIRGIPDEFGEPIVELCDLYLEEFYSSHDLGILRDIQPLIDRYFKSAEQTSSFIGLAHANLLKGKISLVQLNIGDARRYLTQAQDIAEDHGLELLARAVSKEHDKLMEQLDKLEKTEKIDIGLAERLDLASLNDIMAILRGKSAIKAPELVNEDPILLLIITEGGVPLFSYPFVDEWNREDELFASFMSAITSFSSEFFDEGLDRVKFGQYTVLMKSMMDLLSCYLFKGQTYLAKQKLTRFTNSIKNNTTIMEALNKYSQVSQVVELKDFPFLEVFIKDVFGSHN